MRISTNRVDLDDKELRQAVLQDYAQSVNAMGSGGGTRDIDLELGNIVTCTVSSSTTTFTFSNPSPSGTSCTFTLILTDGGSETVNWPDAVRWPDDTAPTLTADGTDMLTFFTVDAGANWYGALAGADFKAPPVFATSLYTGNGSTQTIENGLDLAGSGGLVWIKKRNTTESHQLQDTVRGSGKRLATNDTAGQDAFGNALSFTSNGFTLASGTGNESADTYVAWSFRKATNFFDVVTYTGDGTSGREVAHSLGVAPGMIIFKKTNDSTDWYVYHRSLNSNTELKLNATDAAAGFVNGLTADSGLFHLDDHASGGSLNANGGTYVAYLFAHDTSDSGRIQCGSYTGGGLSDVEITLGWEPQWILIKRASGGTQNWHIYDSARVIVSGSDAILKPNTSDQEVSFDDLETTSDGFDLTRDNTATNNSGDTYIYMAIRA